jgi:two-component system, NarL family, nitrate/nitrite response regulator NarL
MPRGTYEFGPERVFKRSGPASEARDLAGRQAQAHLGNARTPSGPRPPRVDPPPVTTLALIGGCRLMRDATAGLLAAQAGLGVRGTFESAAHFLASDLDESPEILLLDCDSGSCRCSISVLARSCASAKIVLICEEVSEETIRCAMEYRVGGVILKSYSTEDIRQAIGYMASGRTIMPAGWQRVVTPLRRDPLSLSPRLRQILALIAQGHSNGEIATELGLSPNTIKFHVRALYARLGVRNRVEAALLYAQMTSGAS